MASVADAGASCHVTNNDDQIKNLTTSNNDKIIVGDKRKCEVTKKGDLCISFKKGESCITLHEVQFIKEIGKNIMSIGVLLTKRNWELVGKNNHVTEKSKWKTMNRLDYQYSLLLLKSSSSH